MNPVKVEWAIAKGKQAGLPMLVGHDGLPYRIGVAYVVRARCLMALDEFEQTYKSEAAIAGKCGMDKQATVDRGRKALSDKVDAEYWLKVGRGPLSWLKALGKSDKLEMEGRAKWNAVRHMGRAKAGKVPVRG